MTDRGRLSVPCPPFITKIIHFIFFFHLSYLNFSSFTIKMYYFNNKRWTRTDNRPRLSFFVVLLLLPQQQFISSWNISASLLFSLFLTFFFYYYFFGFFVFVFLFVCDFDVSTVLLNTTSNYRFTFATQIYKLLSSQKFLWAEAGGKRNYW